MQCFRPVGCGAPFESRGWIGIARNVASAAHGDDIRRAPYHPTVTTVSTSTRTGSSRTTIDFDTGVLLTFAV